jgi:peptidoglycan hydrolase CwlO-like protein
MSSFLNTLFSKETPEQRELAARTASVETLQTNVAQRELDLATLRGELQSFKTMYYQRVGGLYRERDRLTAEVAQLLASFEPTNEARFTAAKEATEQAQATEDEINGAASDQEAAPFKPSNDLKSAYRQAAKMMHPDRAVNDEDRVYRNEMMAKVNVAYERMDINTLSNLVNEFHAEANIGGGIGRELVMLIRQEAALKDRLTAIDAEIASQHNDELSKLKTHCETEVETGNHPIDALVNALQTEIDALNTQAAELKKMADDQAADREAQVLAGETRTPTEHDMQNASGVHIHRTDRGDFVRSKSELVVANVLHALGLHYHYERKIEGRNTGGKMLPDFVFISSKDELFVWEHLGMLDKPEYRERWDIKRRWYEDNGFVQGVNFFVSRDESDGSLDSQVIRKIALLVKAML